MQPLCVRVRVAGKGGFQSGLDRRSRSEEREEKRCIAIHCLVPAFASRRLLLLRAHGRHTQRARAHTHNNMNDLLGLVKVRAKRVGQSCTRARPCRLHRPRAVAHTLFTFSTLPPLSHSRPVPPPPPSPRPPSPGPRPAGRPRRTPPWPPPRTGWAGPAADPPAAWPSRPPTQSSPIFSPRSPPSRDSWPGSGTPRPPCLARTNSPRP